MSGIPKLVQGDKQDRNVFNTLKRVIRDIKELDDIQLQRLHFETWEEARRRAGVGLDQYEG